MVPTRIGCVAEPKLLVSGGDDAHAGFGHVSRFIGRDLETQSAGIRNDKTIPAISGVDGQRSDPGHLDDGIQPIRKRWHVAHADPFRLALAAHRGDLYDSPWGLKYQLRLGFLHGDYAGLQQHGRNANGIRAGHRRRVRGLHDDPAGAGAWVLWRHQQVHVTEDTSARFIEHEVSQGAIASDETRLLPDRLTWWRLDAAQDDIAYLAFRVTRHDVDHLSTAHVASLMVAVPRAADYKGPRSRCEHDGLNPANSPSLPGCRGASGSRRRPRDGREGFRGCCGDCGP